MIKPAAIDIRADRWVACIRSLAFVGYNFTGATFLAQVRRIPDLAGSPLVDLATQTSAAVEGVRLIYGGTDTIANHATAGNLSTGERDALLTVINPLTALPYVTTDTVVLSRIGIRINEVTMEGLPFPETIGEGERGNIVKLVWDMHITPSSGTKDKYAGGAFIVEGGATQ